MEQTIRTERRRRPTHPLSALRLGGRRREFPSTEAAINAYSDVAKTSTVSLVLFVVLASVFDALFTLMHLRTGAQEANPLMNLALDHGVTAFLAIKVAMTAIGACFLALHQHFPLGRAGMRCLAVTYVALLLYHAAIFSLV